MMTPATSRASSPDPEVPATNQRRQFTVEYRRRILKTINRVSGLFC